MDDLLERPLWRLQQALERGETSALKLTEGYLKRIETVDRGGTTLRAVLSVNPNALKDAERSDEERREGGPRGLLHGLPILLKDNIETRELPTTAGSLALKDSRPERDAFVSEKLRQAGAILLGKTNLSEWANFRSSRSSSGWSSLGGQTRNPYALDRNPCGSSSGSAVAVAASLAAASLGTETDGSIVCPASLCGVVGLKPTVGLVSRRGIVPISQSQDTAGPMTRSVRDAALLLSVLAGADPEDPATRGVQVEDYLGALESTDLKGVRLGVARSLFGKHPGADALAEGALEVLRGLGAELLDPVPLPLSDELEGSEYEVLLYEFKDGLNRYLASLGPGAPRSLAELISFNEAHAASVMPYFGQEHFLTAEAKGPLSEAAYQEARAACLRLSRGEGIDKALREHRLDALVAPTATPAWTTDLVNGDHYSGSASSLAAVAGYPHVTVPAGLVQVENPQALVGRYRKDFPPEVHGLPVGLSFFGAAFQEAKLLRLAHAFEEARGVLPGPSYRQTLP